MTHLTPTKTYKYIINNTGVSSEKGRLVQMDTTTNQAVFTTANSLEAIGVIDEAGVANSSVMRIVIGGDTEVLLDDNVGCTAGDWASAGEVGYAAAAGVPNPVTHFQEVGHYAETVAAGGVGTHVIAKIIMHFN